MEQTLGYVTLVVRDYDEALHYFTAVLGFELIEDTPLGNAKRKTAKDAWILNATSIYSTDVHLSQTTANSFQGLIRYDHDLTNPNFCMPVLDVYQ
jgi:catechol 2,3-dioxygenase-like lactoylglutathione lyase family enzyme